MSNNPILTGPTQLLLHYRQVRAWTERICAPLQPEDYVVQPVVDVSPPKWHLGHTTWFFENFLLCEYVPDYPRFDERFNWFFNSYYESQGPRILRSRRGNMTRPTTSQVLAYRRHVDHHLAHWLETTTHWTPELDHLLTVGLQHEQQHQELLLTDLKYILGHNPLYPVYAHEWEVEGARGSDGSGMAVGPDPQDGPTAIRADSATPRPSLLTPPPTKVEGGARGAAQTTPIRPLEWLPMAAGMYHIGYAGADFCWDNERSRHQVYLDGYALANRLITNQEYLHFMQDGGYQRPELWQMEGWEWVRAQELAAPLYWHEHQDHWLQYTLAGLHPPDPQAPVTHLSWYEAEAYARWAGARLPTEQEWEAAAAHYAPQAQAGDNFLETGHGHPVPPRSPDDYQLWGSAWEWTNSAYLPYPRYPRYEGALGEYNGKFMVNQMVLRGGSCATPATHIRLSYRNFFHPDKRWQFTGIRLAKDVD